MREGNFYAEVGSYVHEILAMIFEGKLSPEDAIQYYIDHYNENIFYKVKQSTMDKSYELIADYFANLDIGWLSNYEILGVELKMEFKIGNHNFVGYIDLLLRDKRDGKIVVIDHKSAEYPLKKDGTFKKSSLKSFESYKKQMYLYCHAVYLKYGEFPKEIAWNIFKDGGKFATLPFIESEYKAAMKWFESTINTIEQEHNFVPTEDYFYCSNICNFRNSCEYHLAAKGGKKW